MLVSTLAIPLTEVKHGLGKMLDIENALSEKHSKMARLLDLERSPSRASLMQDMIQVIIKELKWEFLYRLRVEYKIEKTST